MSEDRDDLSWAVTTMRWGYAGRGLVYVAVAGLSLYAIWSGGQAEGTSTIFKQLESSWWGIIVLALIAFGLLSYAVWRLVCAAYDLEDYGSGAKATIARLGQVTTGIIHGAIGVGALIIMLIGGGGSDDKSVITKATEWVMQLPGGPIIVMIVGAITIGAGLYYLQKGWKGKYQEHLMANEFTTNWNWVLKAGVMSQAVLILIIGGFLFYAGITADPSQAGGTGEAFSWLREQTYGQILVILICLGLLAFALFCFVNARYRIVPKVSDDGQFETLSHHFEAVKS